MKIRGDIMMEAWGERSPVIFVAGSGTLERAIASGKTACVNVKTFGHISPIVEATASKRDKASIE